MLKLLLLPFTLVVVFILFLAGIVNAFVRAIFGGRKSSHTRFYGQGNRQYRNSNSQSRSEENQSSEAPQSKKVIGKDEGEYVDYEEIK